MICISGISGILGRELSIYFDSLNIEYIGTYNNNKLNLFDNKKNVYKLDYEDIVKVEDFFLKYNVTICLFCIVERIVDICEKDWNYIKKTNIDLVNNTSYLCNKLNIKFIHFSTDYVFDGLRQPNYTYSNKNPLQNYGITKLISEYRVISNCQNYCIIRTPVLYSFNCKLHENAVTLISKNLMDLRYNVTNKICYEDNYNIRRPLYIQDLCIFILYVINNQLQGVYHFYNPYNKYTKYEISNIISEILNIYNPNIKPILYKNSSLSNRPYDTQLIDNQYNIYDFIFNNFQESLYINLSKFKYIDIKKNLKDIFLCIDLDGTILDTNNIYYNCYKKSFEDNHLDFISIEDWNNIINNDNINNYINKQIDYNDLLFDKIKKDKNKYLINMCQSQFKYCNNSDIFIKYLIENNCNFCVVTNSGRESIEILKCKYGVLNDIKKWIYREQYINPKPSEDCYKEAIKKYYNNEKYIIGIEDTQIGYNSLKKITDIIYIYNNEIVFNNNDCYIFNDYNRLI